MLRAQSFVRSLAVVLLLGPVGTQAQTAPPPSPEEHFGFAMGTTGRLARWDGILEYFSGLAARSARLRVDTLGPTTLGNPFVVVTMSSPENLRRLAAIHETSALLARGRVPREEAERLAADLPATVFINHNIHSTEIGASQTSVDLVYRMATSDDAEILDILDNVVTVLIPSANPDGQIMVVDWYNKVKDSETPRARMPYLYHHYAGHDNNRDFFQGALPETRYWFDVMYHRTAAQVYLDQHQMGGSGPRMFVPPYPDPMNPLIHPLQWQALQALGGGMVRDLQAAGMQGILSGEMYRIFGQEGALTQRYHNVIGILTETASANLASPDTVEMDALERGTRRRGPMAAYEFSVNMPDPWPAGEWTLGDIVAYQTVAAFSVLRQVARNRQDYILGRWQMAKETMERAEASGPYAIVIPAGQRDPLTVADLMSRLSWQGIEIHRANEAFEVFPTVLDTVADIAGIRQPFQAETEDDDEDADEDAEHAAADEDAEDEDEHDDEDAEDAAVDEDAEDEGILEPVARRFEAGSYIVLVAQPSRAAVLDLLEPRFLPVRREYPNGPFLRMYDGAAYTMSMQMGVETVRIEEPFDVDKTLVAEVPAPEVAPPGRAQRWYAMSSEVNQSYRVANDLMTAGFAVHRAQGEMEIEGMPVRGVFLIPADQPGIEAALLEHAAGVPVYADPADVPSTTRVVQQTRVGLFQGWAGAMDEGWTRLMLEEYGFVHETLSNDDMRDPNLRGRLDIVIIPSEIALTRLIKGVPEDSTLPGYSGGIGDEGVENLKNFVQDGGTLITFDRGDAVVLEHFDVPIRNALDSLSRTEFFLPSSLLNVELDENHDLTAGSPGTVVAKWAGGRAYEPTGWDGASGKINVVGRWAADPKDVLAAGQLIGAEKMAGKAAILEVEYGNGRILMYGFRVQHRMQTHGTFKLLFNAFFKEGTRPTS
ncbi:MAG: hypothetical protein IH876_12805 [Gemmatimonadetes bacterium]|nr:hypothetical protein [Gemmatimonadota bacterium]